jgi:hypothetical protein
MTYIESERKYSPTILPPKSIKADAGKKLTIQNELPASARDSAGIETAGSFVRQRQTHILID